MKKRNCFCLLLLAVFLALAPVSSVHAEENGKSAGSPGAFLPVSVYGHVMAAEGNDIVYYMIEAEEQMCPLTAVEVTFTADMGHSIWAVCANGEQMTLGVFGIGTHVIALPAGVREVGMLVGAGEVDALHSNIPDAVPAVSAYTGWYLSVLGDSLSSVELAGSLQSDTEGLNVASKWWYLAAKEFGMNLLADRAVGSTGVSVEAPKGAGNSGLQQCTRLHTAVQEPDCIFVLLGVNDLFAGRRIQQVEQDYRSMIVRIRSRYPQAEIFLFTYPYIGDGIGGESRPVLELCVTQMNDAIRGIAEEYGLAVIDLYHCGMTADNIAAYVRKPGDIHPGRAGQALMGQAAIEGLRKAAALRG